MLIYKVKADPVLSMYQITIIHEGASGLGSEVKAFARNAGDLGSNPGLGRCPEEVNGNPLQYSCLENPMTEESGGLQSTGSHKVGHD